MTFAEQIANVVENMVSKGFVPVIMIGLNKHGDCIAQGIDPLMSVDLMKSLTCRVVVGDIDPTLLA